MTADPRFYLSSRLAHSYAFHRPPIHAAIWERVVAASQSKDSVPAALDVGCGAGASTFALTASARSVTGVDPSEAMLQQARRAVPDATFVLGKAEALPFPCEAYDVVAAAGSLNYSEPVAALAEISRVLRPEGRFVAYDFSTGRVAGDAARQTAGFKIIRERFPVLPGYALDFKALPYVRCGLALIAREDFDMHVTMSFDSYVEYILGEINVEAAILAGMSEAEARSICAEAFKPLFEDGISDVRFRAVFAIARKMAVGSEVSNERA